MRSILHVDMDAFYASVEQLDNPSYEGKPVIVGADPKGGAGRGVVAACSYEARKFGVHSALPISRAWKLCPEGVYVRPRMSRYVEVSHQVMDVFRRFTDLVEPLSIDEAFLDVTGSIKLYGAADHIAREIKRIIRQETHLTASVGVAPNKFLAKIASDLRKPDGLVVVRLEEIAGFLHDLPISRLWGVGPKTARRLEPMHLKTIGDVAAVPRETLVRTLGSLGEHLHHLANGRDDRPVVSNWEPKSISNETTFERDTQDRELLIRTIRELADEVGRRMRHDNFRAQRITLKLRYEPFETHTKQMSLERPTQSSDEVARVAIDLFNKFPLDRRIRLIGVGTSELVHEKRDSAQLDLFSSKRPRGEALDHTLDEIREKFGSESLLRASQLPKTRRGGE
jgi:nucleotidyltransferase/DNA polymerase involved in DNA repair